MSNLASGILKITDKFKPVLKKVLPQSLLQGAKSRVLDKTYQDLVKRGRQPFDRQHRPDGVNLIGLVRAQMGLGQSCRLLANTLEHGQIQYSLYDFALPTSLMRADDHTYDDKISDELKYNINLIHINPDEMRLLYTRMTPETWDYSYNIAFWLWELEEIPENWKQYFPMLDEIWTPSVFISRSLRKVTDLPVRTMPYWVTADTADKYDRKFFGLPEHKFLFLTMYDSNSTMERKNPMGAVNAYKKAFQGDNDDVGLVIKVNNARDEDLEILQSALDGYKNIYYITKTLEKTQVNSLTKACDAFISLHRAEGFGLVMAEAMLVGTPNIATNWSSNTEFMNNDVACMVDYTFKTLDRDCPPYKKGAVWADADLDMAAAYMRRLVEDPAYYAKIRDNARSYAEEKLGRETAVTLIRQRIQEIYDERK